MNHSLLTPVEWQSVAAALDDSMAAVFLSRFQNRLRVAREGMKAKSGGSIISGDHLSKRIATGISAALSGALLHGGGNSRIIPHNSVAHDFDLAEWAFPDTKVVQFENPDASFRIEDLSCGHD